MIENGYLETADKSLKRVLRIIKSEEEQKFNLDVVETAIGLKIAQLETEITTGEKL